LIYGSYLDYTIYAFDSNTEDLMAIYSFGGDSQEWVSDWSPTQPPASVFTIPSVCYQIPSFGNANPSAPSFPQGFTILVTYKGQNATIYYNGANQMWRFDFLENTHIQIQNTQYSILNPVDEIGKSISPLPCTFEEVSYAPLFFVPDFFSENMGTAVLEGEETLNIWASPNQGGFIWYFDSQNNPVYFLGPRFVFSVSYWEVGFPPSNVFQIPAICVPSPLPTSYSSQKRATDQFFNNKK